MRILTVRQPWAWAIIHGGKVVENRTRNIAGDYRGPVAIHAAASWEWEVRFPVGETPHPTSQSLVRGAIIGVVDLLDVHHARGDALTGTTMCSPWAEWDSHHLVFANPRPFARPIRYRGALGLRILDEATTARVLEAIS